MIKVKIFRTPDSLEVYFNEHHIKREQIIKIVYHENKILLVYKEV